MANTRPLRYGGVMNSGFPTPPPGVFDDEPPGWTHNAAAPSAANNAHINKHVHALDLIHTWAQLAAHMPLGSLVILGDAILTAIARKPSLSGGRTADEIYQDFVRQVSELPKFNAKATCMIALELFAELWRLVLGVADHGIGETGVDVVGQHPQ